MIINTKHAMLLLITGVFFISWSAIFVKMAEVDGVTSAFYRMFFGMIFIFPVWLYRKKYSISYKGLSISIISGILFAIDIYFWNESILLSKASISTLFANISPIWVGLYFAFILKKNTTKYFWTGTTICFLGMFILTGISIDELSIDKGINYAIISSIFYAAFILVIKKGIENSDSISFTFISIIASTITLGIISLFSKTILWGYSTHTWIYLALLGLIPQVLGWLLINYSITKIPTTIGSLLLLLQAVFTAIIALPIINERLNLTELSGLIIVLIGIGLVLFKKSSKKKQFD